MPDTKLHKDDSLCIKDALYVWKNISICADFLSDEHLQVQIAQSTDTRTSK